MRISQHKMDDSREDKSSFSHFYRNKQILAPMVKVGNMAFRLEALRYGADLVYSEEIIDRKFLNCRRAVNDVHGTIDYIDGTDGTVFFQTCDEEKQKVVLQIGTCDPESALIVGKLVENDVFAIDINMGCPKSFSLKGGMGAALLKQPEKIKAILTTLVSNLRIPVTCKIRIVDNNVENTIQLCKMIESCGVAAVAVHGRTKHERPQHENRNHFLKLIAQSLTIPVIANGCSKEIKSHADIEKYRQETGCSSIMLARAAEWNPSIFANKEKEPILDVIRKFLVTAVETNLPFTITKYTTQAMLKQLQKSPLGQRFLSTMTKAELCDIWDLSEFYAKKQIEFGEKRDLLSDNKNGQHVRPSSPHSEPTSPKKSKIESEVISEPGVIVVPNCGFIRGHYQDIEALPKTILYKWVQTKPLLLGPTYSTEYLDKRFRSKVVVGNETFRTNVWEKNKKFAEQGAALACIKHLKLV